MIFKCLFIFNYFICFINSYFIDEIDVFFCVSGRIDWKVGNFYYKKMGMVMFLYNL